MNSSKKVLYTGLKALIFLIIVIALYPLGKMIFPYTPKTVPLTGDLNYGLAQTADASDIQRYKDNLTGQLYFSVIETNDVHDIVNVNVHAYDLQADFAYPVITRGTNYEAVPYAEDAVTVISSLRDDAGQVHEVPIQLNTQTREYDVLRTINGSTPRDIDPSPDGQWVATMLQKDGGENEGLQDWTILLDGPGDDEYVSLTNAVSPQWMNDGADLVYIKEDGIYRYNMNAKTAENIFDVYRNLDREVELAVSPRGDFMLMTLPKEDAVVVLQVHDAVNGIVQEVGRMQTPGVSYVSPVFSPDGTLYATVAQVDGSYLDSKNVFTQARIEVRPIMGKEVVYTVTLDDYISGQPVLSAWSDLAVKPLVLDEEGAQEEETAGNEVGFLQSAQYFLLSLIATEAFAGGGGEGGEGGADGRSAETKGGIVARGGTVSVDSVGEVGMISGIAESRGASVSVSDNSDGGYSVSGTVEHDGGDGGFGGGIPRVSTPGVSCVTAPNVVPEDIYFELASEPGVHVASADLEPGRVYVPKLRISNRGTTATNEGSSVATPSTPSLGVVAVVSRENHLTFLSVLSDFFKGLFGTQVFAGGGDAGDAGGDPEGATSQNKGIAEGLAEVANDGLAPGTNGSYGVSTDANGGGYSVSFGGQTHGDFDGGSTGGGGSCPPAPTGPFFSNSTPFGSEGTFPVRMIIDRNQDNTYEYVERLNGVGPLAGGQVIVVSFPPITFTAEQLGTHAIKATVDLTAAESVNGCAGDWGCIKEAGTPESNNLSKTFTVSVPEINLGSFLIREIINYRRGGQLIDSVYNDVYDARLGNRDITSVVPGVGVYWVGTKVDFATCTGNTVASTGDTVTDFTGQGNPSVRSLVSIHLGTVNNDDFIEEPVSGTYHVYTITCDSLSGGRVSDSIIINNGGDISDIVSLVPGISNMTVFTGAQVSSIPFNVRNTGPNDTSGYRHIMYIDGNEQNNSIEASSLTSGLRRSFSAPVSWTAPDSPTTVPVRVCISHADMSGDRCVSATINVIAPVTQCSDGLDNDGDGAIDYPDDSDCTDANDDTEGGTQPTITATPTLVRKGDEVTVSWDNVGHGCVLSAKLAGEDATTPGSATFTATGETTLTITCGALEDSVTVKVLPVLYET